MIGVPWRMTDGRWTVDRPEVRVDPIPIPPLPVEGARVQRERITKQDIDEFGATIGCPGCSAIKDNKRAQAHSDRCRKRIEECLRNTPLCRRRSPKVKECAPWKHACCAASSSTGIGRSRISAIRQHFGGCRDEDPPSWPAVWRICALVVASLSEWLMLWSFSMQFEN